MRKNKIILFTLIYAIIYIILTLILKIYNYTFLVWIKKLSVCIISTGIILGIIQIIRNINKDKKVIKILLYFCTIVLAFFIVAMSFFYFVFIVDIEEVSEYEGRKMIKETRYGLIINYIKYYDYKNPFIRSMQERVYMHYDDTISEDEYGGTTFYNEDGKEVQDINGTEFFDLSSLKKFASERNASYEQVLNLIEEIDKNFSENISEVKTSDNYLFIYFTNNKSELIKEQFENTIETFKKAELEKEDSYYSIRFWSGYIAICNDTYSQQKYNIIQEKQSDSIKSEITNTSIESTKKKEFNKSDLEYILENNKYYTIINSEKIEIISPEKACDIVDREAKKEKYQYQPWKSEFYSRHESWFNDITAKLILEMSDIDKLYLWEEEWKTEKYKGQLMWQIRMGDANDPLTSLYIYVDAKNGDVLGAGKTSD